MRQEIESTVKIRSTNLKLFVYDNGKLVDVQEVHNAWEDDGLDEIRDFLATGTANHMTHIAGIDDGDTERARDVITQIQNSVTKTVFIRQYLPSASTANGYTIDKIAVYSAASGGTKFAEAEFTSSVAKTSSIQITAEWTHPLADDGA